MQTNLSKRSKGRECALQILYEADVSEHSLSRANLEAACRTYWQNFSLDGTSHTFAESLVFGVADNLAKLNDYLAAASPRWKTERMAAVDRNVLYLGVYELIEGETPPPVVINEAVELAKKYGAEQSAAFVNGILDEIRRTIEQESKK